MFRSPPRTPADSERFGHSWRFGRSWRFRRHDIDDQHLIHMLQRRASLGLSGVATTPPPTRRPRTPCSRQANNRGKAREQGLQQPQQQQQQRGNQPQPQWPVPQLQQRRQASQREMAAPAGLLAARSPPQVPISRRTAPHASQLTRRQHDVTPSQLDACDGLSAELAEPRSGGPADC